ncbi:MAG: hypothetical protein K0Q49_1271 [Haloplasmataceae bacterium]|jgi:hypothetical protein|nr:hypothetical protein [Haloplasmataceae bacterium]
MSLMKREIDLKDVNKAEIVAKLGNRIVIKKLRILKILFFMKTFSKFVKTLFNCRYECL